MRFQDLSGQAFNSWTVLHRDKERKAGVWFACRCVCGAENTIARGALVRSKSRSCGCGNKKAKGERARKMQATVAERRRLENAHSRVGLTFGYWTVMSVSPNKKQEWKRMVTLLLCRCVCGAEKELIGHRVVHGRTTSCGCKRGDIHRASYAARRAAGTLPPLKPKAPRKRKRKSRDPSGYINPRGYLAADDAPPPAARPDKPAWWPKKNWQLAQWTGTLNPK